MKGHRVRNSSFGLLLRNLGANNKKPIVSGGLNNMKPYAFLALVVAVSGFIGMVAAIESPRKPKQERAYVLPLVEDMPTVANPLQF